MSEILRAAVEVHHWLAERHIEHLFIGGLAVQFWGDPRHTGDVDLCIVTTPESVDALVSDVLSAFRTRRDNAADLARRGNVLVVQTASGFPVDIAIGLSGFEGEAASRAVCIEVLPNEKIPVCSAEDLVVFKAVAGRPRDVEDITGVIARRGARLNTSLIRRILRQMSELLEETDPLERFEQAWRAARPGRKGRNSVSG